MSDKNQTTGEFKVRTSFNVSGSSFVDEIKKRAAELIDLIDKSALRPDADERETREWGRLKALAMTDIESGAGWAVKAATV